MMQIDNKTYPTKEYNRYKTQIAKTQIIVGMSLRKDNNHIIRLKNKDYHRTKRWNTYTISRNGVIYEHYDPKYHTDFLDIKEVDKKSISIVLENMGYLFEEPKGKYINWLNEECQKENVAEKSWLGYNHWEKITDEQLVSTVELCRMLCEEYGIPKTMIDFQYYHKDTAKFRGIVFKSNYIEDSGDSHPLFNIGKFNEMLHNEFI
jgi:hypothetical protein